MLPSASRYFTVVMLVFLASFLLVPSSKAINNFYYAFMALPALVLIVRKKAPKPEMTALLGLWGGLLCWLLVSGLIFGDGEFLRHLLYVFLFCIIIMLWIDRETFQRNSLLRCFFWFLIFYVAASASYMWLTDRIVIGIRISDLPNRLSGPILASMLIVSSFALMTPIWVRNRCWIEMIAAVLAVLFCVGFVLQTRTGLVGLAAILAVAGAYLFWASDWRARIIGVTVAVALLLGGLWILEHSELVARVASRLITRADAGRLGLWQAYIAKWFECGLLLGCGPDFTETVHLFRRQVILHTHNVFLAMGFYHGLPALLLFVAIMAVTLREAWKQRNPWGAYLATALLMLNFDGSTLIENPREIWLLVLLPAMLIAAEHNGVAVSEGRKKGGITDQFGGKTTLA